MASLTAQRPLVPVDLTAANALLGNRQGLEWSGAGAALAFLPASCDGRGAHVLRADPAGGVALSFLEAGVLDGELAASGIATTEAGGSLLLAFGTDETLGRGFVIDLGGAAPEVTVFELDARGATAVARTPRGRAQDGAKVAFTLAVRGRELALGIAGLAVPEGGITLPRSVPPGRFGIGARHGTVRLQDLAVRGRLSPPSRARLRHRAAFAPAPAAPRPPLPLFGPLELAAPEDLIAGLPPDAGARLLALRDRARGGDLAGTLPEVESLARAFEGFPGPSLLAGTLRLVRGGDAAGALPHLANAGALPGAPALEADAALALGDLERARRLLPLIEHPHDAAALRALIDRAEGGAASALPATPAACRRCAHRAELVRDLAALESDPALHAARAGSLLVLSDLDTAAARQVLRDAEAFLAAAPSLLGAAPARPLTVLAAASPFVYERWNERLGGAEHEDAVGVYRPGAGLAVIRDDPDPAVTRRWLHHELVHHLLWERALAAPEAVQEGLAELLSTGTPRGAVLPGVGLPLGHHLERLVRLAGDGRLREPAAVLLRDPALLPPMAPDDYAESWLAVCALFRQGGARSLAALLEALRTREPARLRGFVDEGLGLAVVREHLTGLGWRRL